MFPAKLAPPRNTPHVKPPPPHPVAELPRKIERQLPERAKPEVAHLETPAMPTMPNVPSAMVVTPVQPKLGLFASAKHPTVATNDLAPAIKTGALAIRQAWQ
jgi:hypothetical protein